MAELSSRYATALFELALEKGKMDEYVEQSVFLKDVLNREDCRSIVEHPNISSAEKRTFIKNILGDRINDDLFGLVFLSIAKNRESVLIPALSSFIDRGNSYNMKTKAEVVSAQALTEEQILSVKALIKKKLKKEAEVSVKVDPAVIGGLSIQADGYFIDCTLKRQLNDLTESVKRSWPNDSETG